MLWLYKKTKHRVYIITYRVLWDSQCRTLRTEEFEALVQVLWLVRFHLGTNVTNHRCSRALHMSKRYLLQRVSTCPNWTHTITSKRQNKFALATDYISSLKLNGQKIWLRTFCFTCIKIFIDHFTWNTAETLYLWLCNLLSHYKCHTNVTNEVCIKWPFRRHHWTPHCVHCDVYNCPLWQHLFWINLLEFKVVLFQSDLHCKTEIVNWILK